MNSITLVLVYLFLQMCFIWILYRILKNPSVVDASWSVGLMMSGLIYLCSVPFTPRNTIIIALLMLWAFRLAGYLWYSRIRHGHVDKRYTELSNHWKISPSLGFFLNFQLQALLIFMISFLFYWISLAKHVHMTSLDNLAIVLVLIGVIGESIADLQLNQFKAQQTHGVCNIGLWHYSRHPNYFFDWVTWFGFTVFAIQSNYGFFAVISLSVLYLIFTQITGPMTERGSVQSRGQKYIDYQKTTSMFFPWFNFK